MATNKHMDIEKLKEALQGGNLHPVQIESSPIEQLERGHRFAGNLEEYIKAVQVIAAPAVFIRIEILDEFDFFHQRSDQEISSNDETDLVDLRSIAPALRVFEKHLDATATYLFSSALTADSLDFVIDEPWWIEFLRARRTAVDQVDEDFAASEAKARAERQSKNQHVLALLKDLINDKDFSRLPTQKAMVAYAAEKIPELQDVDDATVRTEIQNLHAKIRARGLDRKH